MLIDGYRIKVVGRIVKTARLENEWLDCIAEPGRFIGELKRARTGADCLTFRQQIGENQPSYRYPMEWEHFAAIPVVSYEHWLNSQINSGAKRAIKKAFKKGVEVKVVPLDDEFVRGVSAVVNETPIRQGRPYAHYGKSREWVRAELSKDAARCDFIGAYLGGEMIGFIQLGHGKGYAVPFGMVSMIRHRDKSPQNALLAKSVEVCAEKGVRYLLYGNWTSGGLNEFKQNNGCIQISVPRYHLPLSFKGRVAGSLRLHRGLSGIMPEGVVQYGQELRRRWYAMRFGTAKE